MDPAIYKEGLGESAGRGSTKLAGGARAEEMVLDWACLENERSLLGVEYNILEGLRMDAGHEERWPRQTDEAIQMQTHEVGGSDETLCCKCWCA